MNFFRHQIGDDAEKRDGKNSQNTYVTVKWRNFSEFRRRSRMYREAFI